MYPEIILVFPLSQLLSNLFPTFFFHRAVHVAEVLVGCHREMNDAHTMTCHNLWQVMVCASFFCTSVDLALLFKSSSLYFSSDLH
jgi:hypothetical protein